MVERRLLAKEKLSVRMNQDSGPVPFKWGAVTGSQRGACRLFSDLETTLSLWTARARKFLRPALLPWLLTPSEALPQNRVF